MMHALLLLPLIAGQIQIPNGSTTNVFCGGGSISSTDGGSDGGGGSDAGGGPPWDGGSNNGFADGGQLNSPSGQWVLQYYVGYLKGDYPIAQIQWNTMTHIVFSPLLVNSDGSLNTCFDDTGGCAQGVADAQAISSAAHANGDKALLMLGGMGNGPNIYNAVTGNLSGLVSSMLSTLDSLGYDGIDLDWEDGFPTGSNRFQLLINLASALRSARPSIILTYPRGTINPNFQSVDPLESTLATYLDKYAVQSYAPETEGVGSGWYSWFSSPLTGASPHTPIAIDGNLQLLNAAGIPKSKLMGGIGMWAICYLTNQTSDAGVFGPRQDTSIGGYVSGGDNNYPLWAFYKPGSFYDVTSPGARQYDTISRNPYLTLPTPQLDFTGCKDGYTRYIPYEDEQSIADKCAWSIDGGYGGWIVWTAEEGWLKVGTDGGAADGRAANSIMQTFADYCIGPDAGSGGGSDAGSDGGSDAGGGGGGSDGGPPVAYWFDVTDGGQSGVCRIDGYCGVADQNPVTPPGTIITVAGGGGPQVTLCWGVIGQTAPLTCQAIASTTPAFATGGTSVTQDVNYDLDVIGTDTGQELHFWKFRPVRDGPNNIIGFTKLADFGLGGKTKIFASTNYPNLGTIDEVIDAQGTHRLAILTAADEYQNCTLFPDGGPCITDLYAGISASDAGLNPASASAFVGLDDFDAGFTRLGTISGADGMYGTGMVVHQRSAAHTLEMFWSQGLHAAHGPAVHVTCTPIASSGRYACPAYANPAPMISDAGTSNIIAWPDSMDRVWFAYATSGASDQVGYVGDAGVVLQAVTPMGENFLSHELEAPGMALLPDDSQLGVMEALSGQMQAKLWDGGSWDSSWTNFGTIPNTWTGGPFKGLAHWNGQTWFLVVNHENAPGEAYVGAYPFRDAGNGL